MARSARLFMPAAVLLVLGLAPPASASTSLTLPQSTAFSVLGASCGGIQERAQATGFDAVSGLPSGDVYLQTRCGGSGRGGGYKVHTYSAWVGVTWDFAGAVQSYATLAAAPTDLDPTLSVTDAAGDRLFNTASGAYLDVVVPVAPTGVTATPSGGQFQIAWTPDPATAAMITASTVTVTPVGSDAPVVTATVSGPAASAAIGPLVPSTTYELTVTSTDAGGTSPGSDPVTLTTGAASIVPGAPTGLTARWTAPETPGDTLSARWAAATGGDSDVDQYGITVTRNGSKRATPITQDVSGSTLSAAFAVDDTLDWKVQVRAHDAAGWGPWSASVVVRGT